MAECYVEHGDKSTPIHGIIAENLTNWCETQSAETKQWVVQTGFAAKAGEICYVPSVDTKLSQVLLGLGDTYDMWQFGSLPTRLPAGCYHVAPGFSTEQNFIAATAWGFGAYQFTRYKTLPELQTSLVIPEGCVQSQLNHCRQATYLIRDLINTPLDDMRPEHLAAAAEDLANMHQADFRQIIGEELLTENYPAVYAVGKGSEHEPRVIDIQWGESQNPLVTIIGKGVCFDTGGLDIKPAAGMLLMKKDMAGAAHALGLAHMIMSEQLPIRLRVLFPAVDNAVSSKAYRPGDIIQTRSGKSVEINNTDAEGRLVLADMLTEASSEKPALMIDFATLTGAARIALGPDIGAFFCNNDELAEGILQCGQMVQDPLWRLPLFEAYQSELQTPFADLCNTNLKPLSGGAILAALFLQEFVDPTVHWAHLDIMAWNSDSKPGRPKGGEATGLRAIYRYLIMRFCN